MVLDKIENYKNYTNLSDRIGKALKYLQETNFTNMELGKHIIDEDNMFALLQEYQTKEPANCKLEGHHKYIDVQYMIKGDEVMGVTTLIHQVPYQKNVVDDYFFYNDDTSLINIKEGMFTIFFPDDLHMPCIKSGQIANVRKVVIKVRI